jgi:hypothetical protein
MNSPRAQKRDEKRHVGELFAGNSARPVAGRTTLLIAMIVAMAGTAALLTAVIVLVDRSDWWRPMRAASACGIVGAAMSLIPLLWGMQHGPNKAVLGFFLAGAVRAAAVLGGGMLAGYVGNYSLAPTLLLAMAYYFAALIVEAVILGRSLWSLKL